ncbi:MAG: 16S rRNA (cytosine(1402)-N(4))-methyltransferase RsmH [Firmicutes bacterium]|nr:16S rRNA (cytosine(1402)-N(4))-methyltransferase RsmH [Bacillota bacterium]
MASVQHVPVLLDEVVDILRPGPGKVLVDCTVGGGGHAAALAARLAPGGRLIGLDRDPNALARARERLAPFQAAVELVHADFRRLGDVLESLGTSKVDGVLFDLGVSSFQLDEAERGFTYRTDAPLDMRMDPSAPLTAEQLVNTLPEAELARILREYGEERWAGRIASQIVRRRARTPFRTTGQLVEAVKEAIPAPARRRGPHPARRTFQALRIAVNGELTALEAGLVAALNSLAPGGRLAVISFHSLEDRIVKQMFRDWSAGCQCPPDLPECRCGRQPMVRILTRRPIVPGPEEVAANPRARSARLRAAERTVLGVEEGEYHWYQP